MKKILIVDDEPLLREVIRDLLEMEGFSVTEAEGGHAAVDLVKKQNFDCVLSDIRMSDGDGVFLAKEIQSMKEPKPKVIFMTGFSDLSEGEAIKLGVNKTIAKPFLPQAILKVIHSLI